MKITALLTTTAMLALCACSTTSKDQTPSGPQDLEPAEPTALEETEPEHGWTETEPAEQQTVYTDREAFVAPTLSAACGWEKPTMFFSTDSAKIGMVGEIKMEALATCLKGHPLSADPIKITGYADERGDEDYNRALGLRRANAVKQDLIAAGIDESRITTYSRGEYVADDDGGFQDDRKVIVELDR